MRRFVETSGWLLPIALVLSGCHANGGEGLDMSTLPANVRADYQVFAQRCSKCHALARPLESGISDDKYWAEYVERMRRQPGSGISPKDVTPILRFLHYYSIDRQKRSHPSGGADGGK
jgi:hypothetical protein